MTKPIAAGWVVVDEEEIWSTAATEVAADRALEGIKEMELGGRLNVYPATQALMDEFNLHNACAGWSIVDWVACTCEEAADRLNEDGSEK